MVARALGYGRIRSSNVEIKRVMRFETTRFGNPVMVVGKYRYNRWSYSRGSHVRWTCVKNQAGCRATVTTVDNVIVKLKNFHTHM
ncbi:unnamed protein product [Colias eurytheme]|nr:unnamed protein product [Colias eurytheme]